MNSTVCHCEQDSEHLPTLPCHFALISLSARLYFSFFINSQRIPSSWFSSESAHRGPAGSAVAFHSHFTSWSCEKLVSCSQANAISTRLLLKTNRQTTKEMIFFGFFWKFSTCNKLLPFLCSTNKYPLQWNMISNWDAKKRKESHTYYLQL